MKCTRCGAEVEAQRFCIYCGERLQPRENNIHVQKAPSGVMRFRHRASISQTSLPEVRQTENPRMNLISANNISDSIEDEIFKPVNSAKNEKTTEGKAVKDDQGQSLRQSKELEALLLKLNGSSSDDHEACRRDEEMVEDDLCLDEEDEMPFDETPLESMASVDVDIDHSYTESGSFEGHFEEEDLRDVSETIPMGSGTYSRVPSGGFHLVFDSIKSACAGLVERVKSLGSSRKVAKKSSRKLDDEAKKARMTRIALVAAIAVALIGIIAVVATSGTKTPEPEIAAQAPVAGNEDFAILALDEEPGEELNDFMLDGDDFLIPEFENDEGNVEVAAVANPDMTNDKIEVKEEAVSSPRLTEIRLYGRNDNVMASVSKGDSLKVKRSCIMREGPASRFGLVKEIPSGSMIQVLTNVEDDWILQGGGVWMKDGQPSKLGPGLQFADALKGMKIPQPKSRVISASNWKYVQFGKVYGYVGPACFK